MKLAFYHYLKFIFLNGFYYNDFGSKSIKVEVLQNRSAK